MKKLVSQSHILIETLCGGGGQHDFNICDDNADDDERCIQIKTKRAGGQDEC